MSVYLWIAVGGALGSLLRFALSSAATQAWGQAFPWGTLAVNVLGSFLIGFFAAYVMTGGKVTVRSEVWHFVTTGVLGGFTTFSSFSLQTLQLARDGSWGRAGANIALSLVACFAAVWVGFAAMGWLRSRG